MFPIKVENLSYAYGTRRALVDVTFSISQGEVFGFLGPNGAGKSTTMKILTGFFPPTSGCVEVDGLSLEKNI